MSVLTLAATATIVEITGSKLKSNEYEKEEHRRGPLKKSFCSDPNDLPCAFLHVLTAVHQVTFTAQPNIRANESKSYLFETHTVCAEATLCKRTLLFRKTFTQSA